MLEDNLREIYQAVKFPSSHPAPLVANLLTTRIYDSRYGWGRLWCWFYQITEWITGNNWHLENLKQAILHTHTLFHQELSKVESSLNEYLKYIKKSGKGYIVSESAYFPARRLITKWNASTKPFLKLIQNTEAFTPTFDFLGKNIPVLSFHSPNTSTFHSCQKIMDLEGELGSPLPLATFKKIIRGIPPNAIDLKELDQWMTKIDKEKIGIKSVHKALQAITEHYAKKKDLPSNFPKTLIKLELFLEDKGCKIFQKKDAKHLKWRQGLEKGSQFTIDNKEIILGEELFPQQSGSNKTRAYTIEGQINQVALIAQNCSALPLRDLRLRKENHLGMAPALFLNISSDGRIAFMERLKALNSIQWNSSKDILSPKDSPLIQKLIKLIQEFIHCNFTSSPFSPDCLMFNNQLELKFLKPLAKQSFNFNAIEDFIFASAAGNSIIFQELMVKSGLSAHPIAKFYRNIVSHALNDDTIAPDDLAGIYKISDPKVVDRALGLTHQINTLKEQLKCELRALHPKLLPKQLKQKVNQTLYGQYLQYKTAGILWPASKASL